MKPFSVPSPMPYKPLSVQTLTRSQFFQPALSAQVSMEVIFTAMPPYY
jgi:hypothetical protein